MQDKDVGRLWKLFTCAVMPSTISAHWQPELIGLLLALVENRANILYLELSPLAKKQFAVPEMYRRACESFEIDYADYERVKSAMF